MIKLATLTRSLMEKYRFDSRVLMNSSKKVLFIISCPKSLKPFSFLTNSGRSHWRTPCSSTPGNRILMQYGTFSILNYDDQTSLPPFSLSSLPLVHCCCLSNFIVSCGPWVSACLSALKSVSLMSMHDSLPYLISPK